MPAAIADIAYQNKAMVYDLLFKASAETMLTIAGDPEHLGARIGITSVLQTWGSTLTHHPHVHMIVPGRRHRARRLTVGVVPIPVLSAMARARKTIPPADAGKARRCTCRRSIAVLRPA